MRSLPSRKRILWLVIPLLPVVLLFILVPIADRNAAEAMAERGAKPPVESGFSVLDPGTWTSGGGSARWMNEGVEVVMTADFNPWKRKGSKLGERLSRLHYTGDPATRQEYERLRKLAREWSERIVARYPELAVQEDKDVPDERNGLLTVIKLLKSSVDGNGKRGIPSMPYDAQRPGGTRWDSAAAAALMTENRELINGLRKAGLMTEHSSHGIAPEDLADGSRTMNEIFGATKLLLIDSRLAIEQGDVARAMESLRAVGGLVDHLTGSGATSTDKGRRAGQIEMSMRDHVMHVILPSLPAGQVDLAAWEAALDLRLDQPSDFANSLRGDWNQMMRDRLMPKLVDMSDPAVPADVDLLVELYAEYLRDNVNRTKALRLEDLPGSSRTIFPVDHFSETSQKLAGWLGITGQTADSQKEWLRAQASKGMTQAAFAILRGEPVPNDPVSGLPYRWNAKQRWLSMPGNAPYGQGWGIIEVPKL